MAKQNSNHKQLSAQDVIKGSSDTLHDHFQLDMENRSDPAQDIWTELIAAAVEWGAFRKRPLFFADSLFLKKPSRIMVLFMVMGVSLLIYALAARPLRLALVTNKQTIPDQRGQPTQRPTMRRVFQMFAGIDLLLNMVAGQVSGRQGLNSQFTSKLCHDLGWP